MKRLVFCFDGTWNRLDAKDQTNVVFTAESITPTAQIDGRVVAQMIYYDEGVGTGKWERLAGGCFGAGLTKNLGDAYRFLLFNYAPGDEIYVFGFSRGAYSARSFVGLIRHCGILQRKYAGKVTEAIKLYQARSSRNNHDSEEMNSFRNSFCQNVCVSEKENDWKRDNVSSYAGNEFPLLKIKYLGVWDTVGSLGIPASFKFSALVNKKYEFHDTELSNFVEQARHAVAIDEKRRTFSPTLWTNFDELNQAVGKSSADFDAPYQQQWFPGTHGSVGGGGFRRGLSDQALSWVWDGARSAGLVLDCHSSSRIYDLRPNYAEFLENCEPPSLSLRNLFGWLMFMIMSKFLSKKDRLPGPKNLYEVSVSAQRRWKADGRDLQDGKEYRPATLNNVSGELDKLGHVGVPVVVPETYKIYEVKRGDTLSGISKMFYSDAGKWGEIYQANADKIDHPDKIYPGMSLRIPGVSSEDEMGI